MGYLRLRQICLVAAELEAPLADLTEILGLAVCHRDGNVARYGLVNALLPVGGAFLEIVAPTRPGTAAGRYLERRGGDGGYMVILDCDDLERRGGHLERLGVRVANAICHDGYQGLQLHPRDTGGAMLELNRTAGGEALDGPYHPAGPSWRSARRSERTTDLVAAELQSGDPEALARRWSTILERPVSRGPEGSAEIALDLGRLRFVAARDGRGERLGGLDLAVADRKAILAAARRRTAPVAGESLLLCGTRFRLIADTARTG
ncbi:MAG TPA: VOC family protein [Stellaceae bacterium]|nr:VOC family protein [Stellaceae bacterium]